MTENSIDKKLYDIGLALSDIKRSQEDMRDDISKLDEKFKDYTHLFQFIPVRNVAYGLVGAMALILVGALGTLLAVG